MRAKPRSDDTIQMHQDNFFTDVFAYKLSLCVDLPDTSDIDISFRHSPWVTLEYYEGLNSDPEAPEWTCLIAGRPVLFRQPRGAMAEVFGELALWIENRTEARCFASCLTPVTNLSVIQPTLPAKMFEWAIAIAVSHIIHPTAGKIFNPLQKGTQAEAIVC